MRRLQIWSCLLVLTSLSDRSRASPDLCLSHEMCNACIRTPTCVWCADPDMEVLDGAAPIRCFSLTHRSEKWCPSHHVVQPQNVLNIVINDPLRGGRDGDAVQIRPQRVVLTVRVGEPVDLRLQYAQAENYPVDLYYLMDLSASMHDDKDSLSQLGDNLAEVMQNVTSNFKLGFGSFVDKVEMPFCSTYPTKLKVPCKVPVTNVPCAPPYSFKNHMALSENTKVFSQKVKDTPVSGNLDAPEGGFDAIMQAIVCQKQIGWRQKARHLLVFSTDANFHLAGDGRLAGIIEPNDEMCHLSEEGDYTAYRDYDYPSISQINKKAKEHNINIIFAVSQDQASIYELLKDRIKGASQGALDKTSSNVVDLVYQEYNKIADSVILVDNSSNMVQVRYFSNCLDTKGPFLETKECVGVPVKTVVNFTTTITVLDCPNDKKEWHQSFEIKPQGLNESLVVELHIICDCPCEKASDPNYEGNATSCSMSGARQCGICACNPGRFGRNCECEGGGGFSSSKNVSMCRPNNLTEVCNGLGSCKCGTCDCDKRTDPKDVIYGQFCECDNFSCKRNMGLVCSGPEKGYCNCGNCVCRLGWTGPACECSNTNTTCMPPGGGPICSGHGHCSCGACDCDTTSDDLRYSGRFCEECPTCPGQRCKELRDCVECQAYKSGKLSEEECIKCHPPVTLIEHVDLEDPKQRVCKFPDAGCSFTFQYKDNQDGELEIEAEREKVCGADVNVLGVVLAVVGSIVLIGLLLLLVWKLLTSIHDRREYVKFEKERAMSKWGQGDNPLYKPSTSTFSNPTFGGQ